MPDEQQQPPTKDEPIGFYRTKLIEYIDGAMDEVINYREHSGIQSFNVKKADLIHNKLYEALLIVKDL